MSIIASLFGLLFLITILAGFLFFAIFMARKIGLIKTSDVEEGEDKNIIKSYLSNYRQLSDSLVFRFITIALLIVVMTLPLGMVNDIVAERSRLYRGVLNEIAGIWGHQQNLQGPALFIPYTEKFITEVVKTDKDGYERKRE